MVVVVAGCDDVGCCFDCVRHLLDSAGDRRHFGCQLARILVSTRKPIHTLQSGYLTVYLPTCFHSSPASFFIHRSPVIFSAIKNSGGLNSKMSLGGQVIH